MSRRLSTADAAFETEFSRLLARSVTAPQLADAVREIFAACRTRAMQRFSSSPTASTA